ncbi:MAG: cobalamin-dependent protein [Spirochaetales bacterium]|nr:cobalamin-dependent protein [Spirochaetales bacterium]
MNALKPYGDTLNDGRMQLSFTLPVPCSPRAREAALQYLRKVGLTDPQVVYSEALDEGFTFFVVYATSDAVIDYDTVKGAEKIEYMSFDEINEFIKEKIGRKIVVVGACTGFDAHTVGIDAIMNMKGYNHHFGLERYPMVEAYNLGAQVPNEALLDFAREVSADAVLVSQVVTQKDVHIDNLTELVELFEAENLRDRTILIAGGPRISDRLAMELGYDTGFGPGTYAEHVATFIVRKMAERGIS